MGSDTATTTCHRHIDRPSVASCDDCGTGLCARCRVEIDEIGTFCWECAARRGGLRAGHRPLRADDDRTIPVPGASFDATEGVRRFEARAAVGPSRHLISGLTERLAQAGADPEDVVDDQALAEDIGHLQELAREDPPRHRWARHNR